MSGFREKLEEHVRSCNEKSLGLMSCAKKFKKDYPLNVSIRLLETQPVVVAVVDSGDSGDSGDSIYYLCRKGEDIIVAQMTN